MSSTAYNSHASRRVSSHPTCLACGTEVVGPWCHACGQRHDDCRRSILRLLGETFTDAAALDGRFARTCREIVTKPGRHVHAYAHGRRSPFTPPVRFFLLVSFVFFLTLALTDRHLFVFQLVPTDNAEEGFSLGAFSSEREGEPAPGIEFQITPGNRGSGEAVEPNAAPEPLPVPPVPELTDEFVADGPRVVPYGGFLIPAKEVSYTDEEVAQIRGFVSEDTGIHLMNRDLSGRRLGDALAYTMQNPRAFNNALNEAIPTLMILFIPLMALLGAVFVRGQDALIYDHLLIAIQTHAFAFLIVTLTLWSAWFLPGTLAGWIFFLGVPIYYLLALKGAFGRSWRKSVAATVFVGAVYNLLFVIALFVTMAISLVEIA